MSLNFGRALHKDTSAETLNLGSVSLQKITSHQPVVQSSRMAHSPKQRRDEPVKDVSSMMIEDTNSQNKSATSQGTGLANKIGLAISRILSNTSNSRAGETDEDVADLITLI